MRGHNYLVSQSLISFPDKYFISFLAAIFADCLLPSGVRNLINLALLLRKEI